MNEQIEEIKKILYWHVGAVNCTDADFERCAKDLATRYRKQSECDKCGEKAMKAIVNLQEALAKAKSEWISVEDRLPERKQVVLCYRGDFRGDMMNTYVYLGSGNWEDDYGYRGTSEHEGITHWMPLPEPPKMKGGE